ncbi:hypothetical protein [Flammeovirga agarivorans]|uniref:Uncharacterized protein n=1 Tax=Flammeovirga agarivorans TaxID=2726742 RepID=A0A7X8SHZ4_9BACT|nr:hypothetical protein [Flammeovirga agarivorans]NLR90546.1 hypothetical protein [Flammeovirga agarivorans]
MKSITIKWGENGYKKYGVFSTLSAIIFLGLSFYYLNNDGILSYQLTMSLLLMVSGLSCIVNFINFIKKVNGTTVLSVGDEMLSLHHKSMFVDKKQEFHFYEIRKFGIVRNTTRLELNKDSNKGYYLMIAPKDGEAFNAFPNANINIADLKDIMKWIKREAHTEEEAA